MRFASRPTLFILWLIPFFLTTATLLVLPHVKTGINSVQTTEVLPTVMAAYLPSFVLFWFFREFNVRGGFLAGNWSRECWLFGEPTWMP